MIGAIIEEADPITVFRRYQELAEATKDIVATDIPAGLLPAFVELALKVKDASVTSLPFTNQVIDPESPDYDLMHTLVAEALLPPAEPTSTLPPRHPPRPGRLRRRPHRLPPRRPPSSRTKRPMSRRCADAAPVGDQVPAQFPGKLPRAYVEHVRPYQTSPPASQIDRDHRPVGLNSGARPARRPAALRHQVRSRSGSRRRPARTERLGRSAATDPRSASSPTTGPSPRARVRRRRRRPGPVLGSQDTHAHNAQTENQCADTNASERDASGHAVDDGIRVVISTPAHTHQCD